MSHTPGPWKVTHGGREVDDGFSVLSKNVLADRVKIVAECWPCTIVDSEHRRELSANSRLIAAAPDLLDACEDALTTLRVAVESGLSGFTEAKTQEIVENHTTVQKLKAAIAKAKGDSQ